MKTNSYIKKIAEKISCTNKITIGRTCDMLEVTFRTSNNAFPLILHNVAPFRISINGFIIVTNLDFFKPLYDNYDKFDCYMKGSISQFDQLVKYNNLDSVEIESIIFQYCQKGDLIIGFTYGNHHAKLEVFNNAQNNDDSEAWRFFEYKSGKEHFVQYCNHACVE